MIRINLLPHRQLKRAERQREFGLLAVLVAVATAGVLSISWLYLNNRLSQQQQRNQRLTEEIAALDGKIASIKHLKEQIELVLDRKSIVENLQINRNQAVWLLDELARQLPEGMFLRSVKQQGNEVEIKGVADTNARVATLVHNLGESQRMQTPNLLEIKASEGQNALRQFEFVLKVNLNPAPASAASPASAQVPTPPASAAH